MRLIHNKKQHNQRPTITTPKLPGLPIIVKRQNMMIAGTENRIQKPTALAHHHTDLKTIMQALYLPLDTI
jgi:hypothetical protein